MQFVSVHNGKVEVRSAGSDPADQLNPAVVAAMDELGIARIHHGGPLAPGPRRGRRREQD